MSTTNAESKSLIESIHESFTPTGPDGFEGLIAELLTQLTGRCFRLSKGGGSQGGRDLASDFRESTVVAVECKRYGKDRELEEVYLLGKLLQAKIALPDLDVWVLVVSRPVDDGLGKTLCTAAERNGVEFRAMFLQGLA